MKFFTPKTVFGKVFLVLIGAGTICQIIIMMLVNGPPPPPGMDHQMSLNMIRYGEFIGREILQNPTEEHARRVLENTWFSAKLEGENGWRIDRRPEDLLNDSSKPRFLAQAEIGTENSKHPATDEHGNIKIDLPYRTPSGERNLTLIGPPDKSLTNAPMVPLAAMAATILSTFLASALVVRRILRPMRALTTAFESVKKGNVKIAVPPGSNDEFGRLVSKFNEMASSLDFMIRDREQLFMEISHEFRAPIARALAANSIVEDETVRTQIQSDLRELDTLIHALLTSARMESGQSEMMKELSSVEELFDDLKVSHSENVHRITWNITAPGILVEADLRSVKMLLRNLIENALKYSPPDKPVLVTALNREKSFGFSVQDYGPGISNVEIDKLTTPFERGADTAKLVKPGFGLGLALCHRIIRGHGGKLEIASTVGKGSCFTVWFPRIALNLKAA